MYKINELTFGLDVEGFPSGTFRIAELHGTEELSQLYNFTLTTVSDLADVTPDAMLLHGAAVRLSIKGDVVTHRGIITGFEAGARSAQHFEYRLTVSPRLWLLTLNQGSMVYQEKSVPEIIAEVLTRNGLQPDDDFSFSLRCSYPTREYVVQYQESDLAFLRRWMEYEGICFLFAHDGPVERIVFADHPECHTAITGPAQVQFRDAREVNPGGEAVGAAHWQEKVTTGRVLLKDYNYRTPGVAMQAEAVAAPGGVGRLYEYGQHFKTPEEGERLARLRGEEIQANQAGLRGHGSRRAFRPGFRFGLEGHESTDLNREYLLTRVEHTGSNPGATATGDAPDTPAPAYQNDFTALPAEVPFRPRRETPWPRIRGVMHAHVDAAGTGEYAEIDAQGRYKVTIPFDSDAKPGGKASRYIRMAEPYAGANYGMHFPLHKGTEVLLVHVDGDPDRPIIAAAVPNPDTGSPVTAANQTQSVVRTAGDNLLVMEDQEGQKRVHLSSPHAETKLNLGAPGPDGGVAGVTLSTTANEQRTIGQNSTTAIGANKSESVGADRTESVQGNYSLKVSGTVAETTGGSRTIDVGATLTIKAGTSITLQCGASSLTMNKGGVVNLKGATITMLGAANCTITAPITEVTGGALLALVGAVTAIEGAVTRIAAANAMTVTGGKVDVTAKKDTLVQGANVKINC